MAASELRDASAIVDDWQALRDRIANDGYVFVRKLLDPDLVRQVGRRGLACLQSAGWTEPGVDPVTAAPRLPVRAIRMREAFTDPGYRQILGDAGFNRLAFEPRLVHVMAQLLGPDGFCYPAKLPRVVYPISVVPHQPGNMVHKDIGTVQDMFTTWVPLGDVPQSLGGLAINPGTQRTTRVHHRHFDHLEPRWLTADYEAGDVLIFHCMTSHAALPNHESRMRFSAEYRWQLADQPAPRRLVIGPQGHEIGSRLFSRTPWWKPVPPRLQLFDDGGPDAHLDPIPPSRFVHID